jgi:tetratricopeptide (TPR) repeat protein
MGLHLWLAAALALAPTSVAFAAPDQAEADALSDAAVERFEAKDYDGAVDLFTQAHEIDPQPNYLFNIGRVYEEKGDLKNAVKYYQRFLGESGVDLESRQAATERLKVLREALRELEGEPEPEPEPAPEPSMDPTDDGTPRDTGPDDGRKRKLRIAGYSLLGVGGAALVAGGVVGGIALGTSNAAEDAPFVDETQRERDKAKTQANTADGLFIAGGVLAAVGLVLVLSTLGKGKADRTAKARVWSPLVGPRQVGLGLTQRF